MKKYLLLTGLLLVFALPSAVSAATYRYYDYRYGSSVNIDSSYYDSYVSDRYLENQRYWNDQYYTDTTATRTYRYIPVRRNPRSKTTRVYRTSPIVVYPVDYRYDDCDTETYTDRYFDGEKWVEYERRANCDTYYNYRTNRRVVPVRCRVRCDDNYDGYNTYYY